MGILQTIVHYFIQYGYLVVFVGVMLENAGIPLPGETILLAAGFFASEGHFSLLAVIALGTTGAILGDNTGYLIGRHAGRPFLDRYGHFLFLSSTKMAGLEAFFARHGAKTILIARFISGLRVFAAIFAGISQMHWRTFFLYNAVGAVLWSGTISLVGYFFGQSWSLLERWMGRAGLFVIGTVVIGFLLLTLLRHARRIKEALVTRLPQALSYRELVILLLNLTAIALFTKISEDVVTQESMRFDTTMLAFLHRHAPSVVDTLARWITALGSAPTILVVVTGFSLWLAYQREYRELKALLGVTLFTSGLSLLFKTLFHRQRPHLWNLLFSLFDYSYPSGHSMAAMAVYGMMAYLLGRHYPRKRIFYLLAAILILAIGTSRMLLGVHWPTDVLGGYAAGAGVLFGMIYWYEGNYGIFLTLLQKWRSFPLQQGSQREQIKGEVNNSPH